MKINWDESLSDLRGHNVHIYLKNKPLHPLIHVSIANETSSYIKL